MLLYLLNIKIMLPINCAHSSPVQKHICITITLYSLSVFSLLGQGLVPLYVCTVLCTVWPLSFRSFGSYSNTKNNPLSPPHPRKPTPLGNIRFWSGSKLLLVGLLFLICLNCNPESETGPPSWMLITLYQNCGESWIQLWIRFQASQVEFLCSLCAPHGSLLCRL